MQVSFHRSSAPKAVQLGPSLHLNEVLDLGLSVREQSNQDLHILLAAVETIFKLYTALSA